MTHVYAQLVKAVASRKMKTTAVAFIVAGALMVQAAPPERFHTAAVGGSFGFSLLFTWLFFHQGLPLLPSKQRGLFTLVVLVMLSSLLVVQTHALLALAFELTDRASSGSR